MLKKEINYFNEMKKLIQLFVFKNWDSNIVFYLSLTFYIVFIIGFTYKDILDLKMFLILSSFPVIGYYASWNMDSEQNEIDAVNTVIGVIFLGVALIFIAYKVLK